MARSIAVLIVAVLCCFSALSQEAQRNEPGNAGAARNASGTLRQIMSGHYMFTAANFNSGVIATSEGAVVLDALNSEAVARAEREAIATAIGQPVRVLVSSTFHDNYSKGNVAYADVWKIGHENYRSDLIALMQREKVAPEQQKARLPDQTYKDRLTLYLGGKEIQVLYLGRAHTRGDSIIYVPEDRIAYLSEVYFADQFPFIDDGYGLDWIKAIDRAEALGAEIYVPAHGPVPADPKQTQDGLRRFRQMLVDIRDSVAEAIARGETQEQAVATIRWPQYEKMRGYGAQRETAVRRFYLQLTGALP